MGTICCQRNRIETSSSNGETITQKADSMQMVLDKIYMGSAVAAKNKQLLIDNGITHIIAIGWNLEKHYEDRFEYLLINRIEDSPECVILNQFEKCFNFIEQCFANDKNRLFVHCHKGLSRSATVVIAYEMYRNKTDFDSVLYKIRENRSFIMPNIGFQAQLHEFKNQNYSLDMNKYQHFDVIDFIQHRLPKMLERVKFNYNAYKTNPANVDEDELFELTLYTHQVHKLRQKHKLNENDINILTQSIEILRNIQVEFVQNENSIKRFDIMFRNKPEKVSASPQPVPSHSHSEIPSTHVATSTNTNTNTNDKKKYGSIASSSISAINREEVLSKSSAMEEEQQDDIVEIATTDEVKTDNVKTNTTDKDASAEPDEFPDDPQKSESQQLIA